jgi:hypothetical protein
MPRELELGDYDGEDGATGKAYGYDANDFRIFDPRSSECGRFAVDPLTNYGITPEELLALDEANLKLRGSIPRLAGDDWDGPDGISRSPGHYIVVAESAAARRYERGDGSFVLVPSEDAIRAYPGTDNTVQCVLFLGNWDENALPYRVPANRVHEFIETVLARPLWSPEELDTFRFRAMLDASQLPRESDASDLLDEGLSLRSEQVEFLQRLIDAKSQADERGPQVAPGT